MKKLFFILVLFSGMNVYSQTFKEFAGYTYPVYGTPVAEIYDKHFSYEGTPTLLKCYAKIAGDSVFVTNELHDSKQRIWKVEHARFHIDSIQKQSILLFWDSIGVNGQLQKIYTMKLYGIGDEGIYYQVTNYENFTHFFRGIMVFFERKKTANQFFEDLR